MTYTEHDNFVSQDKEKYIINKNEEFLAWYRKILMDGYEPFVDVDRLQELIDFITLWYEIKYPKNELDFYNGTKNLNFEGIKSIAKQMDFEQLRFRLDEDLDNLIECGYRSCLWGKYPNIGIKIITEEDKINNWFTIIKANYKTGIINKYDLKELKIANILDFDEESEIVIDDLYTKLQFVIDNLSLNYDISDLESIVKNHNYDLELRRKILELIPLSLIYSKNETPEYGYFRAKKFIGEFNKHIKGLNLDTKEIDEIMSRNYDYKEEKSFIKKFIKGKKSKKSI